MMKLNLSVRSVVGSQSELPYAVTQVGCGPTTTWWYRLRTFEPQIDDEPVQKNVTSITNGGGAGGLWSGGTLRPVAKPGKHRLHVKVELMIGTRGGTFGANPDEKAPVERRVTRDPFADFVVVEGQTPIAMVDQPDAATMRSLLNPRVKFNPPAKARRWTWTCTRLRFLSIWHSTFSPASTGRRPESAPRTFAKAPSAAPQSFWPKQLSRRCPSEHGHHFARE